MTQVTHELGRTVIVDQGQTYSLDKDGVLRVKIEGKSGRVQWRTIVDQRRIKAVLKRACIPAT
jgi:hypothetical protein